MDWLSHPALKGQNSIPSEMACTLRPLMRLYSLTYHLDRPGDRKLKRIPHASGSPLNFPG
jgi:hypothetical protein